jgi:CBS domain-containing protein
VKLESIVTSDQSSVVTIAKDASIAEAVHLLSQHHIGALVVSSTTNSIEGILSERDIVRSLDNSNQDTMSLCVHELMTADVITCSMNSTVAELMSLMTTKRIRHVPVVNEGQLCAVVSIGDLVSARLKELELERQHIQDYISG